MTTRSLMVAGRSFSTLKLTTLSFLDIVTDPSNAACEATFQTDGDIGGDLVGTHADEYIDRQGTGRGSPYEIKFSSVTGDTGDLSGPALNNFHDLGTERKWTVTEASVGTNTVTGTITIRQILKTSNSVAVSCTMTATVDPSG